MSSSKRIVLITGANQGVGFETAKNLALSSSDYHVLLGSRSAERGRDAVTQLEGLPIAGTVEAIQIDVTSHDSINAAVEHVKKVHSRLDCLVNNAAVSSTAPTSTERMQVNLATNVVGPVATTEAFFDLLSASKDPRIVFVSSSMGSLTHASDPSSPYYISKVDRDWREYRTSKAALNMYMIETYKRLAPKGFKVWSADPGLLATGFIGAEQAKQVDAGDPSLGGELVASVVRGDRDADVGRVVGRYGVGLW
ncbi:uncharacterized protein K452DRAFT_286017 [Aplosporella prunicola CBS 121167]|uniref:Uncharacterized protein n=1 Tax=Aplosporella prunicola CBS 121167 TaxID=1176127 RepID=A0A6A6BG93_9PEZI|nr:uncharacterized protein K452DRAFT_286017 [Aplosporella prunicola CBS 121167]KAF2143182.1 hypothetical protein K452DRAFT_286017 [Aplosporella prunicola CBS 121167]